jgi:3-dehydroquinate synthase
LSTDCVRVELGPRSYDVVIGPGLIADAGERISGILPRRKVAVVSDSNVADLYGPRLRESLRDRGLLAAEIVVPAGEQSKSFNELQRVVEAVLQARLERGDAVVALGGGVVGDLAGFAAAVTRRGMHLVQVPTTLLAQVDASIGGKTGINALHGKNLVGAFQQPALVLADTTSLDTLPPREFAAGYAEVAKYGLIGDAQFFAWLEANREAVFAGGAARIRAIAESVRAKARIVAADEREMGERALLNLGHSFAHALEAGCAYDSKRLVHGEAVAIGMVLAHEFSAAEGLAPAADAERVIAHLKAAGLPTAIADIPGPRLSAEVLMHRIAQDKKVKGGHLTFILTRGIGRAFIAEDVPPERVEAFLQSRVAGNAGRIGA